MYKSESSQNQDWLESNHLTWVLIPHVGIFLCITRASHCQFQVLCFFTSEVKGLVSDNERRMPSQWGEGCMERVVTIHKGLLRAYYIFCTGLCRENKDE